MFSKNIYPYLIVEVGTPHEGNFKLCKKSIIEAKRVEQTASNFSYLITKLL